MSWRSATEGAAGVRLDRPGVAGGEEGAEGLGVLGGRGRGGCRGGGAAAATHVREHGLDAVAGELGEAPRVDRGAVFAAGPDVLGGAEEADVDVIVVRRAGLAGEVADTLDGAAGGADR